MQIALLPFHNIAKKDGYKQNDYPEVAKKTMTNIEKKARKYVKGLYFDYKDIRTHDAFTDYYDAMLMLRNLFPDSTNEETLERAWDVEWKKENRDD